MGLCGHLILAMSIFLTERKCLWIPLVCSKLWSSHSTQRLSILPCVLFNVFETTTNFWREWYPAYTQESYSWCIIHHAVMCRILNLCATSNSEQLKNQGKIFFCYQDSTGLEKLSLYCDPQSSKQTKGGLLRTNLNKPLLNWWRWRAMEQRWKFWRPSIPLEARLISSCNSVFIFFLKFFKMWAIFKSLNLNLNSLICWLCHNIVSILCFRFFSFFFAIRHVRSQLPD